MPHLQGNLFVDLLNLVGQGDWQDVELYRSIADLLTLPNTYLTGKVYNMLKTLNLSDAIIREAMDQYKNN